MTIEVNPTQVFDLKTVKAFLKLKHVLKGAFLENCIIDNCPTCNNALIHINFKYATKNLKSFYTAESYCEKCKKVVKKQHEVQKVN